MSNISKNTKKVPFHFKYEMKKIDGYGTVNVKAGLILTEMFSSKFDEDGLKRVPLSYVITEVKKGKDIEGNKKYSFMMSLLLGYDKKFAIIDSRGGTEAILERGKWRRQIETDGYFVFGVSLGLSQYKDRRIFRNGSFS